MMFKKKLKRPKKFSQMDQDDENRDFFRKRKTFFFLNDDENQFA